MTELINTIDETFNFNENTIRVIGTYQEPWFVAKDICDILGLSNITNALKNIPQKWMTLKLLRSSYNSQKMNIISEPAVYKLIMRSNKPIAQKFQEVVCEEILPSIRKTGEFKLQKMLDERDSELKAKENELQKLNKIVNKKKKTKYGISHSVYIISNPDIKNCYKIGVTENRNRRIDDLGPGAPLSYKIEYSRTLNNISERNAIESLMLSIFDEYREINDMEGGRQREWLRDVSLDKLKHSLDSIVDNFYNLKSIHNPNFQSKKESIENVPDVKIPIEKKKFKTDDKIESKPRREKRNWTKEEVEMFKEAIDKVGTKWKKILDEYPVFEENGRTNVDLKDKYRNLFGERSKKN